MNRQEAIDRLKTEIKRIEEIMEYGDCGCVDMDTWNEFAKKAEWRETLIELLSGPRPDPTTGLVPCGCGGKAILFHQPDIEGPGSDGDRWAVFCEKTCGMETSDLTSREYAVETWNTGMGYTAPPHMVVAVKTETGGNCPQRGNREVEG